jgi:hypothetical protein
MFLIKTQNMVLFPEISGKVIAQQAADARNE